MKLTQETNEYGCSMFRGEEFQKNAWFYDAFREGDIPDGAIIGVLKAYLKDDFDQHLVYESGTVVGMSPMKYKEHYGQKNS